MTNLSIQKHLCFISIKFNELKPSGIKNCIYFAFNAVGHSPNVLDGTDKPDVYSDDSNHGMYILISDRNMMAAAKLICVV